MRVLALLTDAFVGQGGIARYNQALIRAMASSDVVREIVVLPRHGNVEGNPLPDGVTQLPPVASRICYSVRSVRLALAGGPFDTVFCGHLYMCPLAASVSCLLGVPLWLQLHGIEAFEMPSLLVRKAAESATITTAVSRYTRRRYLQWADADPACVRVLPNIFESQFVPGPKPQHLVERYGLQGRKVLLTVSRLASSERYKGHDRVISVLPKILSRYPDIIYVIVGDGDDRSRIQELAETSGVAYAIRLLGHVADRDLPDYFRMADAFVMPSTGEGFGIVYLEAAASGIPVIAGNSDGSADALADGVLGMLIDPADLNQLSGAIVDALEAPSRRPPSGVDRFAFPGFSRHAGGILGRISQARISTPA